MKILTTCLSASWGGLEMYTLTTAKQLLKHDIQTEILCRPNSRLHQECIRENITAHVPNFSGLFLILEYFRLGKFIKKNKFDLIHSHFTHDLWLIVPSLKLTRNSIPLYLTKHMASGISKKDLLHRWLYSRIDRALAISEMIKNNLLDTTPLPIEKVFLHHNGIDTKRFDPNKTDASKIKKEFGIREYEIIVGMMARFTPGKGQEEFLGAAKAIISQFENVRFMIVGGPSKGEDEYHKSILNLASSLQLGEEIIFTGFRNDTPEMISAMDIFIFPSRDESFGLTLVEAMSMAKPTICTRASGVLDIAIDNETSLLFDRENIDQLTEKIGILVKSPELRMQLGEAGRNRAVSFFDLDLSTKNLIELYKEAL